MDEQELLLKTLEFFSKDLEKTDQIYAEVSDTAKDLLARKHSLIQSLVYDSSPDAIDYQKLADDMSMEISSILGELGAKVEQGEAQRLALRDEMDKKMADLETEYEKSEQNLVIEFEGKAVVLSMPPNVEDPALQEILGDVDKRLNEIQDEQCQFVAHSNINKSKNSAKIAEFKKWNEELVGFMREQIACVRKLEESLRIGLLNQNGQFASIAKKYECQKIRGSIGQLKTKITLVKASRSVSN